MEDTQNIYLLNREMGHLKATNHIGNLPFAIEKKACLMKMCRLPQGPFWKRKESFSKNKLNMALTTPKNKLNIVEFKGRVVAIDEEVAEITIYEEGRNETYTNLDPTYLTDIGLSQGDSFVLTIANDNGIEVPIFKPDKVAMEKIERYIGPKSETSRKEALQSQKDLDELHLFIKHNEPKQ